MLKNLLFVFFFSCCYFLFSQEKKPNPFSIEADYFYGTVLEHNPDIGHLIRQHPGGVLLKFNRKTYGLKEWERRYNYPDWGFSFSYQDMKNPNLGELYSIYSHLNWYFINRIFKVSVGTGIAYATNPYDPDTNYLNNAYGSRLLSATYLGATLGKDNIWNGLGLRAGILLVHYSNGNIKAPNTSTNTFAVSVGINYQPVETPDYILRGEKERYSEPIKFNALLRFGLNSSDIIGMGQFPFYVLSAYADKKVSKKSTFMAGTEIFFSEFLKELIYYRSVAYPEDNSSGDEDYKRVGIFGGYALRFNKVAAFVNLGYYIYYPYDFEGRTYNRLGLMRFFGQQEKIFATINVKAHAAKAEAFEVGVGYRF